MKIRIFRSEFFFGCFLIKSKIRESYFEFVVLFYKFCGFKVVLRRLVGLLLWFDCMELKVIC